ncbi:MAG TPA: OsmC family protein [Sphingomicrobium sp.]
MLDTVKNAPVNGLDLNALGEVVDAIEADAGKALVEFNVTTRWAGQTRSETTVDGFTLAGERIERSHKIVADEPHELLGGDSAANPQELLMAAFNACITVGYVAGASLKGINLESLEIRTRGQLDLRGFLGLNDQVAPGYEKVDYDVFIKGDGSKEDFEEIHRTVMATSPNYFNMSRPIRMNGSLQLG